MLDTSVRKGRMADTDGYPQRSEGSGIDGRRLVADVASPGAVRAAVAIAGTAAIFPGFVAGLRRTIPAALPTQNVPSRHPSSESTPLAGNVCPIHGTPTSVAAD
ncbi:MAG: hypothetical protein ACM3US_05500 [Sphingomonadaceae bacterium]